jgi:hypothetical protein
LERTFTAVDVEMAILQGDLDEKTCMEIPMGISIEDNKNFVIYDLVQSYRKFYEKLINVLKDIGFQSSKIDPCL